MDIVGAKWAHTESIVGAFSAYRFYFKTVHGDFVGRWPHGLNVKKISLNSRKKKTRVRVEKTAGSQKCAAFF